MAERVVKDYEMVALEGKLRRARDEFGMANDEIEEPKLDLEQKNEGI